jgi:hypothetical protein
MTNVLTSSPERRQRVKLWGRYATSSVIAGVISELVFLVAYWFEAAPFVASLVTTLADRWVEAHVGPHGLQVFLVGAAFLGTYGVMFLLKFVLYDRLIFAGRRAGTPEPTSPA